MLRLRFRSSIRPLIVIAAVLCAGLSGRAWERDKPILLSVDATEAPRKLFHVKLTIPVAPGPLTLVYPKWIPGEHGPTGPITDLAGLKFSAGGQQVSWRRDLAEMYAFHCEVPAGASAIDVELDFLSPTALGGFSSAASATSKLAVLNWNQLLLYPEGSRAADVTFVASLRLPPGWRYATALPVEKDSAPQIEFKPVSLETLVDSPVIAGTHLRVFPLTGEGQPPIEIDAVADSEAALEMNAETANHYVDLAAEALALFGGSHFNQYRFLLALSDHVASFGLEHHESSDNRIPERGLLDDNLRKVNADLLPHEFVHSWNGKYRRPADLATSDYQQPMKTDLLWVYEGLTQYLGRVLTSRSGLLTQEETREVLAWTAASLDHSPGRSWRPLVDTAVAAQLLYNAPKAWAAWRRSTDFYDEGVLIWLEADTIIRRQTKSKRSLDDFCKRFHGGWGQPGVKTYTLDDVVKMLNDVAPFDWKSFFDDRVYRINPRAPVGGIEGSGWRLDYSEKPNDFIKGAEAAQKIIDLSFSLGVKINNDSSSSDYGEIVDVIPGQPAAKSRVAPGMKLVAVNGRQWSAEVLHDTLAATHDTTDRFDLLMDNGEFLKTYSLDYHKGERYPHLFRNTSEPDLLQQILKPVTKGR